METRNAKNIRSIRISGNHNATCSVIALEEGHIADVAGSYR